jgi:hypothetical protein
MVVVIPTLLLYVAGGALSAAGGWLFHHFIKSQAARLATEVSHLDARVKKLEH